MTDKPTPEQIQRACDLANSGNDALLWHPGHYGVTTIVTALADTIAQLDAMQAERDKARADLVLIAGIAAKREFLGGIQVKLAAILDIAAPYLVETDPLVECLKQHLIMGTSGWSEQLWADMAKSIRHDLAVRGCPIGGSA